MNTRSILSETSSLLSFLGGRGSSSTRERVRLPPRKNLMTHDQLVNLLHTRPFRPYRLRTASGREIPISHPESIAYGGERTAVVVSGDRWEILDISLVESIEGVNQPTPAVNRSDED